MLFAFLIKEWVAGFVSISIKLATHLFFLFYFFLLFPPQRVVFGGLQGLLALLRFLLV